MAELSLLAGERQSGESGKAVIACNDFMRLGAGRTFRSLLQKYNEVKKSQAPTQSFGTIITWSSRFQWARRAAEYDAEREQEKTEETLRILRQGLAKDSERVLKLIELANLLEAQIYEQGIDGALHNVWLPDVKQVGSGEYAERVDIERFNAALISEYRAVLEDIAKEVGGRIKNVDLTTKGEKISAPFTYLPAIDPEPDDSDS